MEICNLDTMQWRKEQTTGAQGYSDNSYPVFGKGASSAVINDHLYIFGGLDDEDYRNDAYRLNMADLTWKKLSDSNGPSERSYGGMVAHRECLVTFGGIGKPPWEASKMGAKTIKDDKFGGNFVSVWSNDMHEYDTVTGRCGLIVMLSSLLRLFSLIYLPSHFFLLYTLLFSLLSPSLTLALFLLLLLFSMHHP